MGKGDLTNPVKSSSKGSGNRRDQRMKKVVKKNISKKDADRVAKVKKYQKAEKIKERKANRENELQMKRAEKLAVKGKLHKKKGNGDDEDEWEDMVDEHEKDVFDKDGYFDVPESEHNQISKNDEKLLQVLNQKKADKSGKKQSEEPSTGLNLADLIMQKLQAGQFQDGNNAEKKPPKYEDLEEGVASTLDPKLVAAYKSLGTILRSYKSGKLPKLFKVIPQVANWEELLFLTKPEQWSAVSTREATKIFCSNLNSRMTQRFYNLVLLPNVRENINTYKKLNYHLYMALKKSLFKPGAFFKGVLLPIAEDATSREAVIIGSILAKVSIPSIHSSAALIKLTEMEYNIGTGYFIKVLIGKRYALPSQAVDMLVDFFCKFGLPDEETDDETKFGKIPEMPVMWHQTLLSFVQGYKMSLNESQRRKLKALLKVQIHYLITPEIRKELFSISVSGAVKSNQIGQDEDEEMDMD